MPIRLGHFEKPDKLTKSDDSNDTYAKYAAEPFETGFGHTIGNSLRRVLPVSYTHLPLPTKA